MCALLLLSLAAPARAQVAGDDARVAAAVTGGATVGHETSGAVGAEGVFRIRGRWALFIEGGYLWNVATADLAARARRIATAVNGEASTVTQVTAANAGVRVRWPVTGRVEAYVAGGAGVARVRQDTVFSVGGTTVVPASRGIQVGADLSGILTKPAIVAGGGVTVPLARRSFVDFGVHYTRIIARPSEIPHDRGINVVRLHAGVGVRF